MFAATLLLLSWALCVQITEINLREALCCLFSYVIVCIVYILICLNKGMLI